MRFKELVRGSHVPALASPFLYSNVLVILWVILGSFALFAGSDLRFTMMQRGVLIACPLVGAALFRLVLGSVANRLGMKKAALPGMLCLVRLAEAFGWHTVFGSALVPVAIVGLILALDGEDAPPVPRTLVIEPNGTLRTLTDADTSGVG